MSKKIRTFLFILIPIIILFFIVFFAAISLKKSEEKFIENGFIISNNQVTSFNKGTTYKTNLDNEISFIENQNEYKISKESFIHYEDSSIQFLTNGLLLDVENINTDNTVPYYNVDTNDIIDFKDESYILDSNKFENVLGKISDNKYIVMGNDIYLAYLDNNSNISSKIENDFYEIIFQEGNIVNLSSLNFNYQTISNSIYIFVGDNIILDLGSKQICKYNNNIKECVFDITQDLNSDDNSNNNNGSNENKEQTNNTTESNNETNTEIKEETNSQNGNKVSTPKVILESSSVTFNSIYGLFNVIDEKDVLNNKLTITLKNTITNKFIYEDTINKTELKELKLETLAPNSNYLLTIKGEYKKTKEEIYLFQKNFTTNSFGFSVKKELLSTDSITYKIDYDQTLGFDSFDFMLFDEVINDYQIKLCNEDTCSENLTTNTINTTDLETYNLLKISKLKSNTNYTISFDNFTKGSVSLNDIYKTSITLTTLKEMPYITKGARLNLDGKNISWNTKKAFVDVDNSIESYSYEVYYSDNIEPEFINKKNLSKITLSEKEAIPSSCKVILNVYDNEKNISLEFGTFSFEELNIIFTPSNISYYSAEGSINIEPNSYKQYSYRMSSFDENKFFNLKEELTFAGLRQGIENIIYVYGDNNIYLGNFEIETLEFPKISLEWNEEKYMPLQITSEDSNFEQLKENLKEAFIQITHENGEEIGTSSNILNELLDGKSNDYNMLYLMDFNEDYLESETCLNSNNLYSCLKAGNYNIKVIVKDKNEDKIELDNDTREIIKEADGKFSVKYIKEEECTGYLVSYNGLPITHVIKNGTRYELENQTNKLCFGTELGNDEDFTKGDTYQFVRYDKVSSSYYPEKTIPVVDVSPKEDSLTNSSIIYEISIEDPDNTLGCKEDTCEIFYKFSEGIEQKINLSEKSIEKDGKITGNFLVEKDESTISNRYKIYYKASISNLYEGPKEEIILEDSLEFVSGDVPAANIEITSMIDGFNIDIQKSNVDDIYVHIFEAKNDCKIFENTSGDNSCEYIDNLLCSDNKCLISTLNQNEDYYLVFSTNSNLFNNSTNELVTNNILKVYDSKVKYSLEYVSNETSKGNLSFIPVDDGYNFGIKNLNLSYIYAYVYESGLSCTEDIAKNKNKFECKDSLPIKSFKFSMKDCITNSCKINEIDIYSDYQLVISKSEIEDNTISNVLAKYEPQTNYNIHKVKTLSENEVKEINKPFFMFNVTPHISEELTKSYLELNLTKNGELEKEFNVTLSKCDNLNDDRCSSITEIKQTNNSIENEVETYNYIFKNINAETRYKFIVSSDSKILAEYYTYIDSNQSISIGDTKISVENIFNGRSQQTLIINYENSNLIEKIDKILYTFSSINEETNEIKQLFTYTEENPVFYKFGEYYSNNKTSEKYQTALDLSTLDFVNGKYLVEISYRNGDNEVDRISDEIKYNTEIYINKIEDLIELSNKVNNGDSRAGFEYILTTDLDFNSNDSYYNAKEISEIDYNDNGKYETIKTELTTGSGFVPIGYYKTKMGTVTQSDRIRSFSGIFNGNGYTISNLIISNYDPDLLSMGLFGALKKAEVKNLNIKDAVVEGLSKVSVLSGYASDSTIKNVSITGKIENLLKIKNHWDYETKKGISDSSHQSGLLVGYGNRLKIIETTVSGNIESTRYNAGGIAGYMDSPSSIENSKSNVDLNCTDRCGGIVGAAGDITIKMTNYAGNISTRDARKVKSVGGIVGYLRNSKASNSISKLENVSSSGKLDCSKVDNCGGIIGYVVNNDDVEEPEVLKDKTIINKVFSNTNILINNSTYADSLSGIGGIVGKISDRVFIDTVYSIGTINISGYSKDYLNTLNQNEYLNGVGTLVGIINTCKYNENNFCEEKHLSSLKNSYSLSNIKGYVENTVGIGLVGIAEPKSAILNSLYNGGTICEVGNNSINGYIYGGIKDVETLDKIPNFPIQKNNETNEQFEERLRKYFDDENIKKESLYAFDQTYGIKNKVVTEIKFSGDKQSWFENELFKEAGYSYNSEYYPYVSYIGYGGKRVTSPKIKIN